MVSGSEFKKNLKKEIRKNGGNVKVKNKLSDLNNYLFEELERLNDDEELKDETKLKKELERSKAVTSVSQQIINNANVILKAKIHCDQFGDDLGEFLQLGMNDDK